MLRKAILNYDTAMAKTAAEEFLKEGLDPIKAIEEGLAKGVREVGDQFERGEVFLAELMMAAEALKAGMAVLQKALSKTELQETKLGTVVIGTVEGDIHDIGKNLVATMLLAQGFEVYDLGVNVSPFKFIEKAEEVKAGIIAMSALLTSTRLSMYDLIQALNDLNIRNKYKVIVGGAAVTSDFAKEIGADGYGKDVTEAIKIAKQLVNADK